MAGYASGCSGGCAILHEVGGAVVGAGSVLRGWHDLSGRLPRADIHVLVSICQFPDRDSVTFLTQLAFEKQRFSCLLYLNDGEPFGTAEFSAE
jgi:hypothetical protein